MLLQQPAWHIFPTTPVQTTIQPRAAKLLKEDLNSLPKIPFHLHLLKHPLPKLWLALWSKDSTVLKLWVYNVEEQNSDILLQVEFAAIENI